MTLEQKQLVMGAVDQTKDRSGWSVDKILGVLGIARSNYYRWCALADGDAFAPDQVRAWLERVLPQEEAAVVDYARGHPQEGYRRLAWMMADEAVVYLSESSVYRVLSRHDLLYRWKRSVAEGQKPVPATRPDQRWHTDILYLSVRSQWYFLVTVLDAYSRYIVHWALLFSMVASDVVSVLDEAVEKTPGCCPQIVSDCGGQFVSKEFRGFIRRHSLIDIKTRRRHPESNGLIERYHRSLRDEGIGQNAPSDYYTALDIVGQWVDTYNNHRLHSALQYLRPADYYRGDPLALIRDRQSRMQEARAQRKSAVRTMSASFAAPPAAVGQQFRNHDDGTQVQ